MINSKKLKKEVIALHNHFSKRDLNIAEAELVMRNLIGVEHIKTAKKMFSSGVLD